MKDIVITYKRIRLELITLLICFSIGFTVNIVAIVLYKTVLSEIITSLPYILIFTLVIYSLWSMLRLIVRFVSGLSISRFKHK